MQLFFRGVVMRRGAAHVRFTAAMAGMPLRTLAELLGPKTLAMVMRYAHLPAAHLRDAVERIAGTPTDTRHRPRRDRHAKSSVFELMPCYRMAYASVRKWRNWQTRRT